MEKDIISKLLENDSHKEIKITLLAKYSKSKKLRNKIKKHFEELIKWTGDTYMVEELIEALIKYDDFIPIIKEKWKWLIDSNELGWILIKPMLKNETLRNEIVSNIPFIIKLTASKGTQDTDYTNNTIEKIIEIDGGKEAILNNLGKILSEENISKREKIKILKQFKNIPGIEVYIKDAFNDIINNSNLNRTDIISSLGKNSLILGEVLENIQQNEQGLDKEDKSQLLYELLKHIDFRKEENEKYKNKIRELYQEMLQEKECSYEKIPLIVKKFKTIKGLEDIYEENKFIMEELYDTILFEEEISGLNIIDRQLCNITIGIMIKEKQQEKIKATLEELRGEKEEEKPEYLTNGNFSITYKAYGKIIKFGNSKQIYPIPYHPRFMYPIFRRKYEFENSSKPLYIEYFEEGNNYHNQISDDELVKVYLELREDGLFWSDAHKRNLVRLKKDNNIPEYVIKNNHEMFGFEEKHGEHKVLRKGEVVICDLDSVWPEEKESPLYTKIGFKYLPAVDKKFRIEYLKKYGEKCILEAEEKAQLEEKLEKQYKQTESRGEENER